MRTDSQAGGMKLREISDKIAYLPALSEPLSSDVGFIRGERYDWIFDVGNSREAADMIQGTGRERMVVISHFHEDHTGNLKRVTYKAMYCGDFTAERFGTGTAVRQPLTLDDGVKLTVFPIPSTHSRGAVGLEVNEEYAFLGDAVYFSEKNGRTVCNAGRLNEMIRALKKLKAQKFLISHSEGFVQPREKVLAMPEELYRQRTPGEAYIDIQHDLNI